MRASPVLQQKVLDPAASDCAMSGHLDISFGLSYDLLGVIRAIRTETGDRMEQPIRITATEFKQHLGRWLEEAIRGETIEIVRHGGKSAVLHSGGTSTVLRTNGTATVLQETASRYRIRMTLEEFRELQNSTDDRLEFIDGMPILLASPTVLHQVLVGNLYLMLRSHLGNQCCRVFVSPFDVTLLKQGASLEDVLQPDLLVACDMPEVIDLNYKYEGTPKLVVEILSPSTRSRDMVVKLDIYMRSGVEEYWIVDPVSESLILYRFQDREIASVQTAKGMERFRSAALDGLDINLAEIFRA